MDDAGLPKVKGVWIDGSQSMMRHKVRVFVHDECDTEASVFLIPVHELERFRFGTAKVSDVFDAEDCDG